jgi:hypothetical protein
MWGRILRPTLIHLNQIQAQGTLVPKSLCDASTAAMTAQTSEPKGRLSKLFNKISRRNLFILPLGTAML